METYMKYFFMYVIVLKLFTWKQISVTIRPVETMCFSPQIQLCQVHMRNPCASFLPAAKVKFPRSSAARRIVDGSLWL